MLVCGQEEPLQANEMLHSFDEATGIWELSSFEDHRLNRYSFVYRGSKQAADAMIARLVRTIIADRGGATCVVMRQHHPSGDYRFGSLWWLSHYRKQGWTVVHDDMLAIAGMHVDHASADTILPYTETNSADKSCLFLNEIGPFEELLERPARPTLVAATTAGGFAPSTQFLAWLAENQYSVAYRVNHEVKRWGLVVVSPDTIQITKLQTQGIVRDIVSGQDVWKVWMSASDQEDP